MRNRRASGFGAKTEARQRRSTGQRTTGGTSSSNWGFPWPVFRCPKCESYMHSNQEWEEHMASHIRLEKLDADQSK